MKNLNRFCTDINDFEGEGIEVERIWPIYEQKLYDYRGIIDTAEGKKYIYFNEEDIMQVII